MSSPVALAWAGCDTQSTGRVTGWLPGGFDHMDDLSRQSLQREANMYDLNPITTYTLLASMT